MTDSAKLPKIVILGTGGTIVSSGDDPLMLTGYRIKGLNVETLLCAVPELQYFARIEAHQIANIDSSSMTFSIWLELGRAIKRQPPIPTQPASWSRTALTRWKRRHGLRT